MADEQSKMTGDLEQLEKDMQKAARNMSGTQPSAAKKVRDALAQSQGDETKLRMKYSADWIRRGQGQLMVRNEAPITQSLNQVAENLKDAQKALGQGASQQTARNDAERSLQRVEQLRNRMEQMAGQQSGGQQAGKQGGDKQGGDQTGKQGGDQQGKQGGGQQPGGQQPGGQQAGNQGGSPQGGGTQGGAYGGPRYGSSPYGPGDARFRREGLYDVPDPNRAGGIDPNRAVRDIQRELQDLRQQYKDNPDIARQIGEIDQQIQKLTIGEIGKPELEERLRRQVLPNIEALEVQLRRNLEEQGGGQVRSGATDKVPPGYTDAVAEYFRKLSKGKQ